MFIDTARESFNDDWLFLSPELVKHDIDSASIPEACENVRLPHSWNAVGWTYERSTSKQPVGVGWYFKKLPPLDDFLKASIKFEGISAAVEIFLNGIQVAKNLGAYKAFEVPLEGIRGDGSDLVAIKVTDKSSLPLLDEEDDPFSQSSRYKRWAVPMGSSLEAGGIWRDVWLITSKYSLMRTPYIESGIKSIRIQVDVNGAYINAGIKYCLYDISGAMVAAVEANPSEVAEIYYEDAKLWSPHIPVLYQLETSLVINDDVIQTICQPVAFYEFCIRDSQFYFNGMPYFLRGQNGLPHCNVPHDIEYIRRYIERIKDQGVEISRFHTEPPCHAWLDECDRQGLMIIFEFALHGSFGCYPLGHTGFQQTYLEELRSLVMEYRRHPSIMMWCLGNEIIVSNERDIGLGEPLFDILEKWVDEVHRLDNRPVIANSGGDAAESVKKTIGDIDDVHQYGGWYTENLYELHNYEKYICKNDMLFQPMICTESVAAYTDNNGLFFTNHEDQRQEKVVRQRLGNTVIMPTQSMQFQAFILKEYAEAIWRMRRDDTTLGGYIPFGQYTWFFDPFDKSANGLRDKPVWEMYRKVMSPIHIQLECWNRHCFFEDQLLGRVILNHEDISLPLSSEFTIVICSSEKKLYQRTVVVKYHSRFLEDVKLDISSFPHGKHILSLKVVYNGNCISSNDLYIKIYRRENLILRNNVWVYDAIKAFEDCLTGDFVRLTDFSKINFKCDKGVLIIGPYAMDKNVDRYAAAIYEWCKAGNKCIVMEQLPCRYTRSILSTGIGVKRSTQPYWSRWARNMVRHADRADICNEKHPIFDGISDEDLSWWNGDTYLADSYLRFGRSTDDIQILAGIAHGLADDELMPVKHNTAELDYSPLIIEYSCGEGRMIFSNLLIGKKLAVEPVARKLLINMINYITTS